MEVFVLKCKVHARSFYYIWVSSRENPSSGLLTNPDSNQSPQLQRLARKMTSICTKLRYDSFQKGNNRGADQSAWMRSLVCACVVRKPPKTGFLVSRPIFKVTLSQTLKYGMCTKLSQDQPGYTNCLVKRHSGKQILQN